MGTHAVAGTDLVRELCHELLEYVVGLGAYAMPDSAPDDPALLSSAAVQPRDLALCVRVLCPRPLRSLIVDYLGRAYNILGQQTGSDGTTYLACALPLTARSTVRGQQTFTIAVS